MEVSTLLSKQPLVDSSWPRVAKSGGKARSNLPNSIRDTCKVTKPLDALHSPRASPATDPTMDVMNPVSPQTLKHSAANPPKKVSFELLLDETAKSRARIPMRVVINPHDTTDSIIATVKNWYGIYDGHGVSFEDQHGNTLIARYENVRHEMVIHVRIVASQLYPCSAPDAPSPSSLQAPAPAPPWHPPPSHHSAVSDQQRSSNMVEGSLKPAPTHPTLAPSPTFGRHSAGPGRAGSVSPPVGARGRTASQQKRASRPELKTRPFSSPGSHVDEATPGHSDSDGGHSSGAASRKAKSEQFVTAEISLENVLQDGRRNRPKFDSSVLPLFRPPQVPLAMSQSSTSPQRHAGGAAAPSPFALPAHKLCYHDLPSLPSPHDLADEGRVAADAGREAPPPPSGPHGGTRLRHRGAGASGAGRRSAGTAAAVLPTPDPTIASCISDEDVARQLIALGDASNLSLGRTSASTLDDAFSGVADAASSTGATSDSGEYSDPDGDPAPGRNVRVQGTLDRGPGDLGGEASYRRDDVGDADGEPAAKRIKVQGLTRPGNVGRARPTSAATPSGPPVKHRPGALAKPGKGGLKVAHGAGASAGPGSHMGPATLNFQPQLAEDEEDLSSKPRCQRCRKSKKGCDRQRPCQRCKDAGIGIDGCVSEDEGNGRKGRYGRHMGVIVKKTSDPAAAAAAAAAARPLAPAGSAMTADAGPKRKR